MAKLTEIRRIRISTEMAAILDSIPRKSEYVRIAILEKLISDKKIKNKIPF